MGEHQRVRERESGGREVGVKGCVCVVRGVAFERHREIEIIKEEDRLRDRGLQE